jgi:hypothetical protein
MQRQVQAGVPTVTVITHTTLLTRSADQAPRAAGWLSQQPQHTFALKLLDVQHQQPPLPVSILHTRQDLLQLITEQRRQVSSPTYLVHCLSFLETAARTDYCMYGAV